MKPFQAFLASCIYDFLLCDVYSFVKTFWNKLNSIDFPIKLVHVYINNKNITTEYITDKFWNAQYPNQNVEVTWKYNDIIYKYKCNSDDMIEFPPYTLEQLRMNKPSKRIIGISINDKDCFDDFIQYAGPMHDFYNNPKIVFDDYTNVVIYNNLGGMEKYA